MMPLEDFNMRYAFCSHHAASRAKHMSVGVIRPRTREYRAPQHRFYFRAHYMPCSRTPPLCRSPHRRAAGERDSTARCTLYDDVTRKDALALAHDEQRAQKRHAIQKKAAAFRQGITSHATMSMGSPQNVLLYCCKSNARKMLSSARCAAIIEC